MSLLDYLYHFIGIALFVGYAVMIVGLLFRVVMKRRPIGSPWPGSPSY